MNLKRNNLFVRVPFLLFALLFALNGCGGGGGSGDSDDSETSIVEPPITVNLTPVANAGSDQVITINDLATLNGGASLDADQDSLTYQWSFTALPSASIASLTNSTNVSSYFTPDVIGTYQLELVVNDGQIDSSPDAIQIIVTELSSNILTYAIVDTGQVLCYDSQTGNEETCTGQGTDADYAGNQANYTLSSDGLTVTDNVTGLIWQQSSDINSDGLLNYDDKLYQHEAVTHCENLNLSGRGDWRLPSTKEAYSLILFSGKDASDYQGTDTSTLTPFLDAVFDWAFGDLESVKDRIIDGQYASTTLYESTTMNGDPTMFGVNYVDGRIKGYPTDTKEYYVRCVTGNAAYGSNDFIDNSDLTVSDNATGLMWQQDDSQSSNWDEAISQCESATTASFDDWRLPNAKELQSIVDYTVSPDTHGQAAINPIFNSSSIQNEAGATDWGYYWASTTHVNNSGDGSNATYVSFGRALGYMQSNILDVHGAGSQRSNDKVNVANEPGASSADVGFGSFYYKGPQGDILRHTNKVRCVRDL